MTYSLNTIVLEPLSKNKPKNAVILCHGYGGDGNDISILANYWKAHLPDTIFICPDAPEKCAASPTGFQWFDLMDQTPEQILAKSLVAENKLNKALDSLQFILQIHLEKVKKIANQQYLKTGPKTDNGYIPYDEIEFSDPQSDSHINRSSAYDNHYDRY